MLDEQHSVAEPPAPDAGEGLSVARVVLKPRKAAPFFGRHPWVFDSAISHVSGACHDGDIVDLVTDKEKFIARGIINRRSRLCVRLYTWDAAQRLDRQFWRTRFEQAVALRRQLGYDDPQGAARLVFGEADGLSGLIVDRYSEHVVLQVNALAMAVRVEALLDLLEEVIRPASITVRADPAMLRAEGMNTLDSLARGKPPAGPVFFDEHGVRYGVDVQGGQKTGFYLDQRENRRAVAPYLRDRRVLDLFCFSGAFALAAVKLGGARHVIGIDSSTQAIAWARANAELNGVPNVEFHEHDCFDALDQMLEQGEQFGGIVLDPPKFTRSRKNVRSALQAYHRINRVAVELLEPGGILATCSCSGNVTREDFLLMLSGVAQKAGRDIQILEQRGPSPDHPISATCLENEYLKCFICRVL